MSIQRSACSVHSFRCMRRNAFCAPGSAIAFSALRARSSTLTESPKFGLALRQTSGSVQSSSSSGASDEGEPAVVRHRAFQHLDRVVLMLVADAVAVIAGGGDLEQQRLAACSWPCAPWAIPRGAISTSLWIRTKPSVWARRCSGQPAEPARLRTACECGSQMKPPGVRGHPPAALPTPQQGSANG